MSGYFGDYEMNSLLEEMKRFLENHSVAELMEVVRASVETYEDFLKRCGE